jgi:dihydrofolate reductase
MRLTLIAAQSLDGFITKHDMPGSEFASAADRDYFREARRGFDCSILGAETYRSSRAQFQSRNASAKLVSVLTRNPAAFASEAVGGSLEFTAETPEALSARLHARGHRECALLGGSQIHSLFLNAGLVDELWLTLEPLLFGKGTPLLATPADIRLRLLSRDNLSTDTLLLKYEVLR